MSLFEELQDEEVGLFEYSDFRPQETRDLVYQASDGRTVGREAAGVGMGGGRKNSQLILGRVAPKMPRAFELFCAMKMG